MWYQRRNILKAIMALGLMFPVAITTGCSQDSTKDNDPALIARVGRQRLMRSDLDKILTPGLTPADSTKLARAYVKSWIDTRVMGEIASRNIPDMSEIDRMVEDYRNELISWEYRRLMFAHHGSAIYPADSIAAYYNSHRELFILERPLVKGVYIKIADSSPSLVRVRKLYRSKKDADIDRLEKEDLQGLIHYDYFRDRWVDWEQIETRVPVDFSQGADQFLASHDHIEVSLNGYTHLLEITEYLKSGSTMPIEHAEERIKRDLFNLHRQEYDARLRMDLFNQGISEGSIIVNTPLD